MCKVMHKTFIPIFGNGKSTTVKSFALTLLIKCTRNLAMSAMFIEAVIILGLQYHFENRQPKFSVDSMKRMFCCCP